MAATTWLGWSGFCALVVRWVEQLKVARELYQSGQVESLPAGVELLAGERQEQDRRQQGGSRRPHVGHGSVDQHPRVSPHIGAAGSCSEQRKHNRLAPLEGL